MNLIDRTRSLFDRRERRAWQAPALLSIERLYAEAARTGATAAENLAVVGACVNVIASNIAAMPVNLYRRTATARVEVYDHPILSLYRHGPNPFQVWGGFIESVIASVELQGNALIELVPDASGALGGMRFLPWAWVTMVQLPSGRVAFDVYEPTLPGASAIRRRLLAGDVIHLKARSDDGLIGMSSLGRARDVLATATAQQTFARSFLDNGAAPSILVEYPGAISAEQKANIRAGLQEKHGGAVNAGRALILDGGLTAKPWQVSPEDAELLASRRFAVEEIARVFGVPPPMIGDLSHGTFTNSREAARWFGQFTLTPRVRRIESEFNRALFGAGSDLEIEFDMSSLLRSDPESRWASHKIAVEAGILDPNEIREIEGYNPRAAAPVAAPAVEAATT